MFLGLPQIIQGGMGVGVSSYRLAREVSSLGQLGTVSGVAIEKIFARNRGGDRLGSADNRIAEAVAAATCGPINRGGASNYIKRDGLFPRRRLDCH